MPPFADQPDPGVVRAWKRYQREALRPAGGLAPGAQWKKDGASWTPETAMVAYTAAASGQPEVAQHWLDWLQAHTTTWGSLPEKVLSDGSPSGPAPLAWSAAAVVLAVTALEARRTGGDQVSGGVASGCGGNGVTMYPSRTSPQTVSDARSWTHIHAR